MYDILYHVDQPRPSNLRTASCLLGLVLALVAGCASSDPEGRARSPAIELESAIGPNPEAFGFTYRSRGTQVLDCVLPNREFSGAVFGSGDFVIQVPDRTDPVVIRTMESTYLSSALFAVGSIDGEWLSVEPADLRRLDQAIRRSLGTDLSGYALSATPPATGRDIILDAVDDATSILTIDPIRVDGVFAPGYRLMIDGADDQPGVVLDTWIDSQGQVTRVEVQRPRADDPDLPNPDLGWLIDYRPLPTPSDPIGPPENVVDAGTIDPDALSPPVRQGCDLQIGPEPSAPPLQP